MPPGWLTILAWVYLSICFACAAVIAYDIFINGRRQPMGVMDAVFPITALYFGPLALAFYWRWTRTAARTATAQMPMSREPVSHPAVTRAGGHPQMDMGGTPDAHDGMTQGDSTTEKKPWWVMMATEVSHCGSGCVLGDVISEFAVFALGLAIFGLVLGAEYVGDYVLALAFGIAFQYFAIAPMRGLGIKDGLKAAAKADTISLTFFEIGLFGWMAIMTFVLFPAPHHLMPNTAAFWLLMQVGMMIGYATSWPANMWLVKRGIKVPM